MALASTVVWEVRTTGDDNNGGGFNTASSGTDYSQQDTPVLTVTDGATGAAGSTTLTSATGGFTADMVGNVCHIYGGTNTVEGWYEITGFTDSNTVTLDRAPDNGSGGISNATVVVGGALASPGGLGKALQNASSGNKVWIAGGTYPITSSNVNVPGGRLSVNFGTSVVIEGYGTTRGDGGKPIFSCQVSSPADIVALSTTNGGIQIVKNIIIDGNGNNPQTGFNMSNGSKSVTVVVNCEVISCNYGFDCTYFGKTQGCISRSCDTGFYRGSHVCSVAISCFQGFVLDYWTDSGCIRCIARSCTDVGFLLSEAAWCYGCISYGNSGSGFKCNGSDEPKLFGCISVKNGGYGFEGYSSYNDNFVQKCASYGNTSGRGLNLLDIDPIILSGDPFVDGPNGDFRLNDAAGAVLKDAGIHIPGQQDKTDLNAFDGTLEGSGAPVVIPGPSRTKWWV